MRFTEPQWRGGPTTPPTQRRHPALRDSDGYQTLNANPTRFWLSNHPL
jgi:hypothetical protein